MTNPVHRRTEAGRHGYAVRGFFSLGILKKCCLANRALQHFAAIFSS